MKISPLLALLCLAAVANADLYGNPSPPPQPDPSPSQPDPSPPQPDPSQDPPPPPFAVKGKVFPPQTTFCINPRSRCFGKTITCPAQCPEFKPADPTAKGCYINCRNPKCEAVCRNRKPNCNGNGAACYDPRFVGGDGVMFYFHGKAGGSFALVSDASLHINARFIGLRPAGRSRDFTWIQSLAVLFGDHSLTIAATPSAAWDPTADHLSISFDGFLVPLPVVHLSAWSSSPSDPALHVERIARANSVAVSLPGVFEIMASAVPVTPEDDRVHRYGIPVGDCFAHLEVQFRFFDLSEAVEGVLGKTYRPDFQSPVKRGVDMPIMGGEDRYETTSLLRPDCKQCIFNPNQVPLTADARAGKPAAPVMDCTGEMNGGYAVVCRR